MKIELYLFTKNGSCIFSRKIYKIVNDTIIGDNREKYKFIGNAYNNYGSDAWIKIKTTKLAKLLYNE